MRTTFVILLMAVAVATPDPAEASDPGDAPGPRGLAGDIVADYDGPIWYVSPDGDDDGEGSQADPFRTIQRAVDVASPGHIVELADGLYVGPGNHDIQMGEKAITVRSGSGAPETCVVDCAGNAGFVFVMVDPELEDGPRFDGLSIRDAAVGISVTGLEPWLAPPILIQSSHCRFLDCDDGVRVFYANARISDSVFHGNREHGASHHWGWVEVFDSEFRANDIGMAIDDFPTPLITVNMARTVFAKNDIGLSNFSEFPTYRYTECRFDSNRVGLKTLSTEFARAELDSCLVRDNSGDGIQLGIYAGLSTMRGTRITGNGGHGIMSYVDVSQVEIEDTVIAGNVGWGVYAYPPGGDERALTKRAAYTRYARCRVDSNLAGGIFDQSNRHVVEDCLITRNGGDGLRLSPAEYQPIHATTVTGTTIADNAGIGLAASMPEITIANVLVAANGGAAAELADYETLAITCVDLHGNGGGDWTGPIESYLGQDGNISLDPNFCGSDNPTDPYTLADDSPCAAENNVGCGQIGARGLGGCGGSGLVIAGTVRSVRGHPMNEVVMTGLPGGVITDESGNYEALVPYDWTGTCIPGRAHVTFTPPERIYDAIVVDQVGQDYVGDVPGLSSIDSIQTYDADGLPATDWLNLLPTVEGTVYVTPGTYSAGGGYIQGDDGGINFYYFSSPPSLQVGDRIQMEGYVWWDDNREIYLGLPEAEIVGQVGAPPPIEVPIGQLVGDHEYIGSFVKVAGEVIEKGTLPGDLVPYVLISDGAAAVTVYIDPQTDANLDEVDVGEWWSVQSPAMNFSGEIRLSPRGLSDLEQVPTAVQAGEFLPETLALHNQPNPFNPATTIVYELPHPQRIDLRIFDVQGRLVFTLVAGDMRDAGRHESVWRGRDRWGHVVAAGIYFCRLQAGAQSLMQRMTLVK